jgi:hypothetical protein
MKRMMIRIISLGLMLMLCAGAAAQDADDLSYTMSEKLMKQLNAGSGFIGTLTLNATAAEGRENDAYSTVKPLVLDWTYIKLGGDEEAGLPDETRLTLTLDVSEYQQGSAEISVQDGKIYMRSSLLDDNWYLLGDHALQSVLGSAGIADVLPAASQFMRTGGLLSGTASFFSNMALYLIGGNTDSMTEAMEQYTTKIDFWLEGYRDSVQVDNLDDGTSVMEIAYRIPAAAVKAQLKQLLIDLMNDAALLTDLQSLMPKEQADLFLEPSLQPYYFYTVDELPLADDLVIRRVMSFLGETVELSVTMPLYDSVSGAVALTYTRKQGGEDMPYDNTLKIEGEDSYAELTYRTYETITGTTMYQGTVVAGGPEENGEKPKPVRASFDLSLQSVTTKDLNGYETLNQSLKLSILPVETPDALEAAQYDTVPKTEFSLNISFASLAAKNAPTDATMKLKLSGDDMAQEITLDFAGATTANWTPEAFDRGQAVNLTDMSQEKRDALVSQAVVKGGLLVLPYINLPQVSPAPAE